MKNLDRRDIVKRIDDFVSENQGIQFNPTAYNVFSHLAAGAEPLGILLNVLKHVQAIENAHFKLTEAIVNIKGIEVWIADPQMREHFVNTVYKGFKNG